MEKFGTSFLYRKFLFLGMQVHSADQLFGMHLHTLSFNTAGMHMHAGGYRRCSSAGTVCICILVAKTNACICIPQGSRAGYMNACKCIP